MAPLGPPLTVFLREYLPNQREMSVQTSDTYAYAFQLLVCFAAERLKVTPSELSVEQLDATLVLAFLEHLEKARENCARTRNSRLAAIKTFFKFLEYRLPTCLEQARRVRAIPVKKTDEVIVGYLNREEIQALLDAPDPSRRDGLRDRAMLHLAYAGGLRVSELVGLNLADLTLHPQPSIHVMGKGRRERILPLWKETASTIRDWLKVRGDPKGTALFHNARGDLMTRSGFKYILSKHLRTASAKQPGDAAVQTIDHVMRRPEPPKRADSAAPGWRLHITMDGAYLRMSVAPPPDRSASPAHTRTCSDPLQHAQQLRQGRGVEPALLRPRQAPRRSARPLARRTSPRGGSFRRPLGLPPQYGETTT